MGNGCLKIQKKIAPERYEANLNKQVKEKIVNGNFSATRINFKKEHARALPFKELKSRLATAEVLAFLDYSDDVILIMLRLSHITRAYIKHADLLRGFLIDDLVSRAIKQRGLKKALKW